MSSDSLRLRALAAALTLLSGGVMMLAGYLGHTESWTTAGLMSIPGGIVILAALALARTADRSDSQAAVASSPRAARAGAGVATLLSGGVMILAGYAVSAWGWGLAVLLATAGGLVVGAAFALDRRGTQATTR